MPGDTILRPDGVATGGRGGSAFSVYAMAAHVSSARFVPIPLRGDQIDLESAAAAVNDRTRAVFICSPHNPTSTALGATEFVRFMAAVPDDLRVVLDEAYAEFVTAPGAVRGMEILDRFPNLVVLRTFSKAYGFAGLRIGYAVAHTAVIAALRKVTSPFSVSRVSEAAAIAALQPAAKDEFSARLECVADERERVSDRIRLMGFDVPESQANFVWVPAIDAAQLAHELERASVIVRVYPESGLRITIGTPEENDALLDTLLHAGANVCTGRPTDAEDRPVGPRRRSPDGHDASTGVRSDRVGTS